MFGQDQSTQDMAGSDVHVFSSRADLLGQEELDDVQKALRKEITIFERREKMLGNFKVNSLVLFSQCTNEYFTDQPTDRLTD